MSRPETVRTKKDRSHSVGPQRRARDQAPIDPSALARLVGEDRAVHLKLWGEFVDYAKRIVREIHEASGRRSHRDVGALAHRLKSAARGVGANALADAGLALEEAGRSRDWLKMRRLGLGLTELVADVARYVETLD